MIRRIYTRDSYGYAEMQIEVAGRVARISPQSVKRTLLELGCVFLGDDFEDVVAPVTLPADPADGRPETTLYGFTTDPEIVAATREFFALVDEGRVPPEGTLDDGRT